MYIKDSHLKHLSKIDKVQKRLIEKYDKPKLSKSEDYILDLCKYIIFQQISTKAGNSIYQRFIDFYNLNKNNIILWKEEDCKKIGLSKQKKNYIENIFNEKNSINDLYDCTDQAIIRSKLIKIKGVGNWTIDMFMIFTKGDLNIFPEGDLALINAIKKEYKVKTLDEIRKIAEKWAPYKTIATLYLWESLEDDFPS